MHNLAAMTDEEKKEELPASAQKLIPDNPESVEREPKSKILIVDDINYNIEALKILLNSLSALSDS